MLTVPISPLRLRCLTGQHFVSDLFNNVRTARNVRSSLFGMRFSICDSVFHIARIVQVAHWRAPVEGEHGWTLSFVVAVECGLAGGMLATLAQWI